MLNFLNLKGYEMHLFGIAKIKAFCKPVFLPGPHPSMLRVTRSTISCFNIVLGAWGMILLEGVNFFATILSKIVFHICVQNLTPQGFVSCTNYMCLWLLESASETEKIVHLIETHLSTLGANHFSLPTIRGWLLHLRSDFFPSIAWHSFWR